MSYCSLWNICNNRTTHRDNLCWPSRDICWKPAIVESGCIESAIKKGAFGNTSPDDLNTTQGKLNKERLINSGASKLWWEIMRFEARIACSYCEDLQRRTGQFGTGKMLCRELIIGSLNKTMTKHFMVLSCYKFSFLVVCDSDPFVELHFSRKGNKVTRTTLFMNNHKKMSKNKTTGVAVSQQFLQCNSWGI